jgi:hypothetical protein
MRYPEASRRYQRGEGFSAESNRHFFVAREIPFHSLRSLRAGFARPEVRLRSG